MKPTNTLILFCDQHNPEITGCYGNRLVKTPNIDRLAQNGTMFTSAYTTTPLCVPARASMATGDYPSKNGFWDNAHPFCGKQMSWGRRLAEAGHKVTAIGKLHFSGSSDEVFPGQVIPLNVKGGVGDLMTACRNSRGSTGALKKQIQSAGGGDCDYIHYDREIAKRAADYLKNEAVREEKPWCLYVGFTTPHYPLKAPKELLELYEPFEQFDIAEEWHRPELLHPAVRRYKEAVEMTDAISDSELRRATAAYYAMVTFMDSQVGVVLDALKEAGLDKNTRIIYSDDHGDSAGAHGLFFKSTMNEGSARIPMIISGPGIPKGETVSRCTSIVDIYPTILDFMGIEQNDDEKKLPGISLMKTITEKNGPERSVYSEYHAAGFTGSVFMVRQGSYKLIYYTGYECHELYDLSADPGEKHNLAGLHEYASVFKKMLAELYKVYDPEKLNAQSLKEQKELLDAHGGLEAVAKKGLTPFSAVPDGMGIQDHEDTLS